MPKWCKFLLAALLLPVCYGAVRALWLVLRHSGDATTIWVGFLSGAACWLVVYSLLPKPMWVYVFGHELTHALWTWLMGGRVKAFKASSRGGHVIVTKTNFLIALAPYLFPVYATLVVLCYVLGNLIWDWAAYSSGSICSSVLPTLSTSPSPGTSSKTEQSDITQHGYFFSAVIIFLGNIALLLVGVPLLTARVGVLNALGWWLDSTRDALVALQKLI